MRVWWLEPRQRRLADGVCDVLPLRRTSAVIPLLWAMAATAGCASGADPEPGAGSFGDPTYNPVMTAAMTAAGDDAADDDSDGSDDAVTSDGGDTGEGDTVNPNNATSEAGDDDTDDGNAGDGPQPEDGMYSHCLSTAECVGVNTCVTIFDAEGEPFDGFCTLDNCTDAATDCEPSPGGDVAPVCVEITLNGNPASACALDCVGGKVCPNGMTCYEDDGIPVCA